MAEFSLEKRGNFPSSGVAHRWYLRRINSGNVQIRIADSAGNLVQLDYVLNERQIIAGSHLEGGGNLSTNRSLKVQFTANAYVGDSEGNRRLYFGNESSINGCIIRASATGQRHELRTLANSAKWRIDIDTGTLQLGTVPWSRLTDRPSITAGTGLSGGGFLTTNRTISFDTSWGDSRYLRIANAPVNTSGSFTPALKANSSSPTYTVSSTAGKWQRVGNLIKVHARVTWISLSGGAGSVYLTLPSLSGSEQYDTDSLGVASYRGVDLPSGIVDVVADAVDSPEDCVFLLGSSDNLSANSYIGVTALNSSGSITIDITLRIIQIV